jgi:uncharacterized protein
MLDFLRQPWHWSAAGLLIGLIVPTLLLIGNKHFGISSNLRHLCAACLPARIPFFQYNWRKETWNFFFVGGILLGGAAAAFFLQNPDPVQIAPALQQELSGYGLAQAGALGLMPAEVFSLEGLFTLRGLLLMVGGGFLIGFGTRYAGGCTSGHSIMGLSNLQLPSLIATLAFMAGGFLMANLILPLILQL